MNKKLGFTLIEVLSVVMILAILTAIALPQYSKSVQRATAANALINVKTIFDSAKRFKSTSSHWPTAFNQLDVELADINVNDDNVGVMGEFSYSLSSNDGGTVSACRTADGAISDNTFCITAHYLLGGRRDVYTCTYASERFLYLCESLGTCTGTTCEIR